MALFGHSDQFLVFLLTFSLAFLTTSAQHTGELYTNSTDQSVSISGSASETSVSAGIEPSTAHPSTTTTSGNVGDFIAAGMGLTRKTSDNIVKESETTATSSGSELDKTMVTTTTALPATITTMGYQNLSFIGNCWEQWSSYWSADSSASFVWTQISSQTTYTQTYIFTSYSYSTEYYSGTVTETVSNGAFAQTTFTTVTEISREVMTFAGSPTSTTVFTRSDSFSYNDLVSRTATFLEPACILPSRVPECQASWDAWYLGKHAEPPEEPSGCTYAYDQAISLQPLTCQAPLSSYENSLTHFQTNYWLDKPVCTQAAVTGTWCSTLVGELLSTMYTRNEAKDGVVAVDYTTTVYTTTEASDSRVSTITTNSPFWNPSLRLAPGCTLGCQSCQINGGTVQLIYWPPASSTYIGGTYSAINGNRSDTQTVVTLGTTLTSPTVYVSFDSLWARDSCSRFGKTYFNEILAITQTAAMSSIYGWDRHNGLGRSASFNFTDLYVSPVPDDIYQSQPRCASSMSRFDPRVSNYLKSNIGNWTCPRTAPYEPILAIPMEVRNLDPGWADCVGGIYGVYDPPIALTPANAIAKPTMPGGNSEQTSPAVPASTPKPTAAVSTLSIKSSTSPAATAIGEAQGSNPAGSHIIEASASRPTDSGHATEEDPSPGSQQSNPGGQMESAAKSTRISEGNSVVSGLPRIQSSVSFEPSQHDPVLQEGQSQPQTAGTTPESKIDALSVLLAAQSSIPATAHNQEHADPVHPPQATSQKSELSEGFDPPASPRPLSVPNPTVLTVANGDPITIQQVGSSIVVQQGGSAVTVAQNSQATIAGHIFSAAPDGGAIIVDHSITHSVLSSALGQTAFATVVAGGETITALRQGSNIVLAAAGDTQTQTIELGGAVKIGSQTANVASDGEQLVVGSSTVVVPANIVNGNGGASDATRAGSATTLLQNGSELIASAAEGAVVIQQGTNALTLAVGKETVLDGNTFSAARSGGALIINQSETIFAPIGTLAGSHATASGASGASEDHSTRITGDVGATASSALASQPNPASSNAGARVAKYAVQRLLAVSCIFTSIALLA